MDDLISSRVTLRRQRILSLTATGGGDNKIKYMTEEEESPVKKAVGAQEEEKSMLRAWSGGRGSLKRLRACEKTENRKRELVRLGLTKIKWTESKWE